MFVYFLLKEKKSQFIDHFLSFFVAAKQHFKNLLKRLQHFYTGNYYFWAFNIFLQFSHTQKWIIFLIAQLYEICYDLDHLRSFRKTNTTLQVSSMQQETAFFSKALKFLSVFIFCQISSIWCGVLFKKLISFCLVLWEKDACRNN